MFCFVLIFFIIIILFFCTVSLLPRGKNLVGKRKSQALLGQGGGDLVGERGQLRRIRHVDAAGGGHVAEGTGRAAVRGLADDLRSVVGASSGLLAEGELMRLDGRPRYL